MALGVTLSVPFHNVMKGDPEKFGRIPDIPYRLAFQQIIAGVWESNEIVGARECRHIRA
jgi:hypothetical protein